MLVYQRVVIIAGSIVEFRTPEWPCDLQNAIHWKCQRTHDKQKQHEIVFDDLEVRQSNQTASQLQTT